MADGIRAGRPSGRIRTRAFLRKRLSNRGKSAMSSFGRKRPRTRFHLDFCPSIPKEYQYVLSPHNPDTASHSQSAKSDLLSINARWQMKIEMRPIGTFYTKETDIPRHWSISKARGRIEIIPDFSAACATWSLASGSLCCSAFTKARPFSGLLRRNRRTGTVLWGVFHLLALAAQSHRLSVLRVTDIRKTS